VAVESRVGQGFDRLPFSNLNSGSGKSNREGALLANSTLGMQGIVRRSQRPEKCSENVQKNVQKNLGRRGHREPQENCGVGSGLLGWPMEIVLVRPTWHQ
jgi:hypothetical protein